MSDEDRIRGGAAIEENTKRLAHRRAVPPDRVGVVAGLDSCHLAPTVVVGVISLNHTGFEQRYVQAQMHRPRIHDCGEKNDRGYRFLLGYGFEPERLFFWRRFVRRSKRGGDLREKG